MPTDNKEIAMKTHSLFTIRFFPPKAQYNSYSVFLREMNLGLFWVRKKTLAWLAYCNKS
jgi:hypothetical protein